MYCFFIELGWCNGGYPVGVVMFEMLCLDKVGVLFVVFNGGGAPVVMQGYYFCWFVPFIHQCSFCFRYFEVSVVDVLSFFEACFFS